MHTIEKRACCTCTLFRCATLMYAWEYDGYLSCMQEGAEHPATAQTPAQPAPETFLCMRSRAGGLLGVCLQWRALREQADATADLTERLRVLVAQQRLHLHECNPQKGVGLL